MKYLMVSIIAVFMTFSLAYGQSDSATVNDMKDRLKSEEFNVGLLLQSVGAFSFEDDSFNGGRQFGLGATRLDIKGELPSNFIYRLQLDFRRSPSVMDAQIGYKFSENFRIVTGAFKPFLSADLDPSPAATDFVNRARLVGAMMNSREVGVTFLGESEGFNYRIGIYNGNGRQMSNNDNRFLYTARFGYSADLNEAGGLDFGVNGAINTSEMESVGRTNRISEGDRLIYGAFIKYSGSKFFGTVEFLETRFDDLALGLEETITGFYGTVGVHATEKSDLLLRWDYLSGEVIIPTSDRIVAGWNYQMTELVSFQLNGLYQLNDVIDDQAGISANLQFYF
ncbi:porin [Rhodohalobacter halophilus]|uniref:porin n=1 Tax=Rhodohalobacter halophilus TaxID=1812810 RepID=UPI00114CD09B|nr:porin [Rhodohalobacter halophilus]